MVKQIASLTKWIYLLWAQVNKKMTACLCSWIQLQTLVAFVVGRNSFGRFSFLKSLLLLSNTASNIMIEAVYFPVQTTEKQSLPLRLLNMIYYKVFQISRRKSAVIGNIELFNHAPWEFSPQSDYFKLLLHIWGTKPINVWLFSTFILVAFIGFSACECWFCLSRWKLTCEENIMEQLSIVVIQS